MHEDTINIWRPRQNWSHFADDIFKCIFLNKNVWIWFMIWLQFVPKFRINNISALVQTMLGIDQETSHYLNQWWLVYWHIYASLFPLMLFSPSKLLKKQECWLFKALMWRQCITFYCVCVIMCVFCARVCACLSVCVFIWYFALTYWSLRDVP